MQANTSAARTLALTAGWLRIALRGSLSVVISVTCLVACTDTKQEQNQQLEQAVNQVTRILNDASRNIMAAAALQSTMEGGGTLVHDVAASLPEKFNHRVSMDRPEVAWSIVLRHSANPTEVTVEGYGSDLQEPLFTRTAKLVPVTPRR